MVLIPQNEPLTAVLHLAGDTLSSVLTWRYLTACVFCTKDLYYQISQNHKLKKEVAFTNLRSAAFRSRHGVGYAMKLKINLILSNLFLAPRVE